MPNYKQMYLTLVDEVTNAIDGLKSALEKAEDIYIESNDTIIEIISIKDQEEETTAGE